jgi:TonB family protein
LIALAIIPLACGASPVIKQQVRLLTKLSISYPDAARAAGHQGTVRLRLSINTEGRIEDVEVVESSRSAVLDAAAVEQAKALTLPPAINVEDKPVSGMRLYNLFLGVLAMGAGSPSKAFEKTVERCADKPDEKYWDNIQSRMNAWF